MHVQVLNGSGVSGQASQVADALGGAGFDVTGTGNAPQPIPWAETTVLYRAGDEQYAQRLARQVTGGAAYQESAELESGSVALVTGSNFTGHQPLGGVGRHGRHPRRVGIGQPRDDRRGRWRRGDRHDRGSGPGGPRTAAHRRIFGWRTAAGRRLWLTMPIEPDTKDWTWVLERPCDECRFDASALPATAVPAIVRGNAIEWRPLLLADDGTPRPGVAERPADDRWAAIEYACHVRDVFRLYDRATRHDADRHDPTFPNWDQDEAAVADRYLEQDPAQVAADLEAAGEAIAASFDAVEGDQWQRTGVRSDGAHFTVDTFARYFVHDPVHHVFDVEENYRRLDGA